MRRFPAYKLPDIFDLYATTFFLLIEEARKLDAENRLEEIQIAQIPTYEKASDVKAVINGYYKQAIGKDTEEDEVKPFKSQLKGYVPPVEATSKSE